MGDASCLLTLLALEGRTSSRVHGKGQLWGCLEDWLPSLVQLRVQVPLGCRRVKGPG